MARATPGRASHDDVLRGCLHHLPVRWHSGIGSRTAHTPRLDFPHRFPMQKLRKNKPHRLVIRPSSSSSLSSHCCAAAAGFLPSFLLSCVRPFCCPLVSLYPCVIISGALFLSAATQVAHIHTMVVVFVVGVGARSCILWKYLCVQQQILRGMPLLSVEAALTGNGIQWKWYNKEYDVVLPIVNKAVIVSANSTANLLKFDHFLTTSIFTMASPSANSKSLR